MSNLTMAVVHILSNRVRIKLSHPLKEIPEAFEMIKEHEGIEEVQYNNVTKSIIVYYNEFKMELEEVIVRVAIVYAKDYNFAPVSLVSCTPKKELGLLSYYSLGAITVAWMSKYANSLSNIQEFFNWLAVGTTVGAIGEHAYSEIQDRGTFDPEVMSVLYLINSVQKKNFLGSTSITWVATFGRHLLSPSYDKVVLKTKEVKDLCTGEVYYNINVLQDNHSKGLFLSEFVSKFVNLEKEKTSFEPMISITKSGINNHVKNGMFYMNKSYCGFSSACKAINVKL